MTPSKFDKILDDTLLNCREVMGSKSSAYARDNDKLHNFKRAAEVGQTTAAKALLGMKLKHDVSILDIVDDYEVGTIIPPEVLDEKIGDAINYLILLKALLIEGYEAVEDTDYA